MNHDPDDPRLTAYALGELDEAEIPAIEAQLAESAESRQVVADVRATARYLTEQLHQEPGLAPEHHQAIEGQLPPSPSPSAKKARSRWTDRHAKAWDIPTDWVEGPPKSKGHPRWHRYAIAASVLFVLAMVGFWSYAFRSQERHGLYAYSVDNEANAAGTPPAEKPANAPSPERYHKAMIHVGSAPTVEGISPAIPGTPEPAQANQPVLADRRSPESLLDLGAAEVQDVTRRKQGAGGMSGMGGGAAMQGMPGAGGMPGLPGLASPTVTTFNGSTAKALSSVPGQGATGAVPGGLATKDSFAIAAFQNVDSNAAVPEAEFNTEAYDRIRDNDFKRVTSDPDSLSTFSIDVDTASYANIRRFLTQNTMPPKDAVRIEEMVNYFTYDYPQPDGDDPFSINIEIARCPWEPDHRLARIGLKGKEITADKRPLSNLVFLLDVSGSMQDANKLPLVKAALRLLIDQLGENDRVSMIVYAGASGMVLPPTPCNRKTEIVTALDNLQAGGSTNGGAGIQLAYDTATANFIKGGTNRVILCTDGDFNVGVTNQGDLTRLIEEKAKSGVFLSVLGFGMGNLKDATMEQLADKGNGNYAYIDTLLEARKVLVEQLSGTLVTIAKDVKIQVEFNPARVAAYRLIGYENRVMPKEHFNDDTKDAGEIGAGHTVTALYELVPAGQDVKLPTIDALEFSRPAPEVKAEPSKLSLMVKLRYKQPDADQSILLKRGVEDEGHDYGQASNDFRFAASVASFGMLLRDSPHKGNATYAAVLELAEASKGVDASGYRKEFLELVRKAQSLQPH